MIGKTISHYKIIEKLGAGGMGTVYKAQDTKLDRFVALKFLPPHLSQDEENKKRFIHEAKAASALDHPNICTIYEIDETEDGQMFIAMACYEGESLKEKLEKGPLPIDEAMSIAIQIAEGLAKAHSKNILHRDIKPANILVTEDGMVKIVDFGLAKLADRTMITKDGTTLGTVAYMSPEQAQGVNVDHRTDIWALGVVMYEMFTGQTPFKGDYEQAVIYSIMNEEPEPITGIQASAPPQAEQIVSKALTKNADLRYQHVDDLLMDLQRGLAKPQATAVRAEPKKMVSRFVTAASVLVAVLILFFVVQRLFFTQSASIAPSERRSIAVMYFDNLSNDSGLDWMQKGIVELLNAGLSRSTELRVVDTQRLSDLLRELGKEDITKIDQLSATEVAEQAGVGTMIRGNIIKIDTTIRLQAKVLDVGSGEILLSDHVDGKNDEDLFAMVAHLAESIRSYLEVKTASEEVTEEWLQHITTNSLTGFQYFVQGREFTIQSHWQDAKRHYEKAVAIDSTFTAAWVGLTASCWNLGDYKAMNEAYAHALRLREKASHREK
ncbi:MAG: protein kinase, partial [Phycisphaerae bacterium]|nr:protein kinase [Phycisphaerae bacterium]NIU57366.1 protein kinase [Phycisphaerae bacterium]NIW93801.1 protein kinase [Phycisphaerae bacterium]